MSHTRRLARLEFSKPDLFRITPSPNRHVSFGHGPHICVTAAVARIQLRALFTDVAEFMADLAQRDSVERLASHLVAGIKRVPVSVR